MNFLSLEYFLAVAAERNFTTAAAKLYVSQQSLSEHIRKLEQEVGVPLILRNRPLELTPAGKIFEEGARTILDTKRQMLHDITVQSYGDQEKLTLAISTFEAPPLLSGLIAYFHSLYPDIEVEVVKRPKNTLPAELDDISFYFDFAPLVSDMSHYYYIHNDFCAIACRQRLLEQVYPNDWQTRLAQIRKNGNLAVLAALPFAVLKRKNGQLSQFTLDIFDSFGITPNIRFRTDNGELNTSFCLQGSSATVGSFFYERSRYQDLITIPDNPMLVIPLRTRRGTIPIALSYPKDHILTPTENAFLKAGRNYMTAHNQRFEGTPNAFENIPSSLFYG